MKRRLLSILSMLTIILSFTVLCPTPSSLAAGTGTAQAFVDEALKYVGYTERQFETATGTQVSNGNWCVEFIQICAARAGVGTIIPPGVYEPIQKAGGTAYSFATYGGVLANASVIKRSDFTPQVGDILCIRWAYKSSGINHGGIVASVNTKNHTMTVVDGNAGNGVVKCRKNVSYRSDINTDNLGGPDGAIILAYVRPNWAALNGTISPSTSTPTPKPAVTTAIETGKWLVTVPSGTYVSLYASADGTKEASSVYAKSEPWSITCFKKATLPNGTTRYCGTFNDRLAGEKRDYWFSFISKMTVQDASQTSAPTPTPAPTPTSKPTPTPIPKPEPVSPIMASGKWRVTVPSGTYVSLYSSADGTKEASSVYAKSEPWSITCFKKATLPNGTIRYCGTFNDRLAGEKRDYWFAAGRGMSIEDQAVSVPTPTPTAEPTAKPTPTPTAKPTPTPTAAPISAASNPTPVIKDGLYELYARCAPSSLLDVNKGSSDNKANVQIWSRVNRDSQKFIFTYVGGGYYTITSKVSGKMLDVADGSSASGTNVWQYRANGSDAQKWSIREAGGGYYYISPKVNPDLCLDVNGGYSSDGTNVQVWTANQRDSQKWALLPTTSEVDNYTIIPDGTYEMYARCAPSHLLDVNKGSTADKTNIQIWSRVGKDTQRFIFTHTGDGWYTITSKISGKVLDVADGSSASGTNVWQYRTNGSDAQKWRILEAGGGYYYLVPKHNSDLRLDVNGAKAANGTNVQVWYTNKSDSQKWALTKLD